ncbi:6586_t:CDS:10 [Entrophospora sp. SA101]|nr:6586_t:CDS:10 [Entrophospora sp. SA101]
MNYDIKQINDPIHGYMEFDDWAIEVIDTPEFQRLRNLKQLGTTYFVYPGASHNRFEHCLGVGHLSNKLLKQLYKNQPELKSGSFESDLKCVTLAGLCHDLGHGPFSHVFDNRVIPKLKLGVEWSHEEGSVKMFDHLIDENHIDLNPEEVKLIKSLITGKDPSRNKSENSGREFLFDIVANKRNSIDVDKFDYLERDCYNIGIKSSYDSSRLMKFSRVIDDQICYSHKESHNIYELFHTRYSLHKKVYQHPVATAIDHMLADALVMANDVFKFSESIFDPSEYLKLDDSILNQIEFSKDKRLKDSQEILKRIRKRQLYKLVDELLIPSSMEDKITKKHIEDLMALNRSDFHEEDIIVHKHKINYSKKSDNPVDSVKFYKKHCDKDRNETSYLAPEQFEEVVIRIYTKKPDQLGKIQNAFRDLIKKHYSITTASTDYSSGYVSVALANNNKLDKAPTIDTKNRPPGILNCLKS